MATDPGIVPIGAAGAPVDDVGTALVLVSAVAAFVVIARRVSSGAAVPVDHAVRRTVQAHRNAAVDAAVRPITLLSLPGIVLPATLLTAWWLHRQGRTRAAEALVLAPALAMTAGAACSALLTQRNPPDMAPDTEAATDPGADTGPPEGGERASHAGIVKKPSFPSGHTTGVTAEALSIAYVLHRERLVSPRGLAALLGWPVLVGTSRLYRDRHWASDVVGGWAAGTAVAALCAWWYDQRAVAGRAVAGSAEFQNDDSAREAAAPLARTGAA